MDAARDRLAAIRAEVARQGHALLDAGPVAPGFAASFEDLALDAHMGDGGRYRLRRHATFAAAPGKAGIARQPHRPHRQALAHNRLNGDVDRWFEPVLPEVEPALAPLLAFCRDLADGLQSAPASWDIEVHQFRILGQPGTPGLPTPEGVHRDGVDLVFIMLVGRRNVSGGRTLIQDAEGRALAEVELAEPGQAMVLDDHRIRHGVTPIAPLEAGVPATRDVLVVTLRRA
ncbi:2OG-Fe dioxygenase family protein [Falsiroseomonas sp. HC035]|uniref:2OG-Fe dioxygenase family protein n=1 Tax=Falsiroseomonas sp. HC035 TaxID=3390999 RepID=UPI003D31EC78